MWSDVTDANRYRLGQEAVPKYDAWSFKFMCPVTCCSLSSYSGYIDQAKYPLGPASDNNTRPGDSYWMRIIHGA